ncbi:hypothetical protein [Spirochaeta dissipatitropha]
MNFKAIFLLFNIIILLSFAFIIFLPFILLDAEYTRLFWSSNWYLAAVFFAFFAGINAYFLRFWKVYQLLEREDWTNLQAYLKAEILDKQRFRSQYLRLYIHNAVVRSKPSEILELRQLLEEKSPRMHVRFGLLLGLPYILENNHSEMERFYSGLRGQATGNDAVWIEWLYIFSVFLQHRLEETKPLLEKIINRRRNYLLRAMALYMYDAAAYKDRESRDFLAAEKARLKAVDSRKLMGILEKEKENVVVLILDQFIRDALNWLYADKETSDD